MPTLDRPSVASLYITAQRQGQEIATATGFVVRRDRPLLITNRHVVLHPPASHFPDALVINHNRAGALGDHVAKVEMLYDPDGRSLWYEHPGRGSDVDVVALPLTQLDGVDLHAHDPYDQKPPAQTVRLAVTQPLNIVGFPFGELGSARLGIWVRGFIASEPEIMFRNLPCFLIDSRTRSGQSGSPVIVYARGGQFQMEDGSQALMAGVVEQFVGVYSGRIDAQSDLGFVWTAQALREVIDGERRPDSVK
jgi:hypothetical protein